MSDRIDNWVKNLVKEYKKARQTEPTFKQIVKDCIYLKGINSADFIFNHLKDSWIRLGYDIQNFTELHEELFEHSKDYYFSEIIAFLEREADAEISSGYTSMEDVSAANKKSLADIGIIDVDTLMWKQIEEMYEYDYPIHSYVLEFYQDYISIMLLIPDNEYPLLDYKTLEANYQKAKIPIREFYNERKNQFDKSDVIKLKNKTINVKIIMIDREKDIIIAKPLKN